MSTIHVTTTVNGDEAEFLCDPRETLLDALRDRVGLTGAKEGCGTGDCGACSVTLDGRLVCSCLILGVETGDEGRAGQQPQGRQGEDNKGLSAAGKCLTGHDNFPFSRSKRNRK